MCVSVERGQSIAFTCDRCGAVTSLHYRPYAELTAEQFLDLLGGLDAAISRLKGTILLLVGQPVCALIFPVAVLIAMVTMGFVRGLVFGVFVLYIHLATIVVSTATAMTVRKMLDRWSDQLVEKVSAEWAIVPRGARSALSIVVFIGLMGGAADALSDPAENRVVLWWMSVVGRLARWHEFPNVWILRLLVVELTLLYPLSYDIFVQIDRAESQRKGETPMVERYQLKTKIFGTFKWPSSEEGEGGPKDETGVLVEPVSLSQRAGYWLRIAARYAFGLAVGGVIFYGSNAMLGHSLAPRSSGSTVAVVSATPSADAGIPLAVERVGMSAESPAVVARAEPLLPAERQPEALIRRGVQREARAVLQPSVTVVSEHSGDFTADGVEDRSFVVSRGDQTAVVLARRGSAGWQGEVLDIVYQSTDSFDSLQEIATGARAILAVWHHHCNETDNCRPEVAIIDSTGVPSQVAVSLQRTHDEERRGETWELRGRTDGGLELHTSWGRRRRLRWRRHELIPGAWHPTMDVYDSGDCQTAVENFWVTAAGQLRGDGSCNTLRATSGPGGSWSYGRYDLRQPVGTNLAIEVTFRRVTSDHDRPMEVYFRGGAFGLTSLGTWYFYEGEDHWTGWQRNDAIQREENVVVVRQEGRRVRARVNRVLIGEFELNTEPVRGQVSVFFKGAPDMASEIEFRDFVVRDFGSWRGPDW